MLTLCPIMSRVEGDAVLFVYCGVECALHVVEGFGDEIQGEEFVGVEVVEETWGCELVRDLVGGIAFGG